MTDNIISKKNIFIIGIIISGGFITYFNQTVISPAMPSIMDEFHINAATAQWLTTAYLLVNGIMVPITAYLINKYTTRALFTASMLLFATGTCLAFISPNFVVLLTARVFQAMGAGIQMPLGMVCMMEIFPKSRRGFALGIVGLVVNFAPAIGPTISGWIIETWTWRVVFGVTFCLSIVDIIFALLFLRNVGKTSNPSLDWFSVVLSTFGFGGLLFGFSYAGSYGWLVPLTLAPMIVGIVSLILFVKRQRKLEEPLLEIGLLHNRTFSISVVLLMILFSSLMVGSIILPLMIQNVMGHSAIISGIVLLPGAIGMCALSPISGVMFDRFGPRKLVLTGFTLLTASALYLGTVSADTSIVVMAIVYTFRSMGITLAQMPINTWGINALDNRDIAHGNAISNTLRQVAGSIGTAILITVMTMFTAMSGHNASAAESMNYGINAAFIGAGILTLAGLIIAFVMVDRKGAHNGQN